MVLGKRTRAWLRPNVEAIALAIVVGGHMFARWSPTVAHERQSLQQALAGRYVIERELGHGGSATVYLARDLKIPRLVALKVLAPELAMAVRTERFQREIAIAARLNHAHILPLFEADAVGRFLFYTMPPVYGESLGVRLSRIGRLPVDEALGIAGQVAEALEYAHGQSVIHRDIKPGNLLLDPSGHVWVADFGIARAIAGEASEPLTDTGSAMGTVAYMSPEQISGAVQLDGQTDIYSLGCVLYEMLVGAPPYTGPTAQSVLAKQLVDPIPPIGAARPDVPNGIVRIVERALAKDPRERLRTAGEFRAALAAGRPARRVSRRPALAVTLGLILVGGVVLATQIGPPAVALDELRYVVLPLDRADTTLAPGLEGQLRDAIRAWTDITVVDELKVREALAERGRGALTNSAAEEVARSLGAARLVRGEVAKSGDSLRLHAAVFDATGRGAILPDATIKIGRDLADSLLDPLAEGLLFGRSEPGNRLDAERGTRSFRARNAMVHGLAAVDQWELAPAESSFVAATQADANYAQAHLWVAQVRYWSRAELARWRSSIERAAAGRERLSSHDRALVDALSALAVGQVVQACKAWEGLTRAAPHDFAAWYGLANCLQRDNVVVPDRSSPSRWRFRSSYHHALQAYQQAFRLLPAIHKSLRTGSYETVRFLLMTSTSFLRLGRALPPDTTQFLARPMWQGDSLVFLPDVWSTMTGLGAGRVQPTRDQLEGALRHGRQLFRDIATAWLAASPQNSGALEAMAISLEMLGDPSCLDTLRRARTLESDPGEQVRLAGNEVWVRLKFSVPTDLAGVRAARALADSILRAEPSGSATNAKLLASLAVVTGRAALAAAISRQGAAQWDAPVQIMRTAPALLVYASLGGPADTLSALERQVAATIDNAVPAAAQQQARMQWLARAAELAFPDVPLPSITRLAGRGDHIVDAQADYVRGDTAAVRRRFATLRAARRTTPPASVTLDGLYPEAALLAALGDQTAAIGWLDSTLNVLAGTEPGVFADPARAGAFVRAIVLRAELADRAQDREAAAQWAQVVPTLWSDADPFLRPRVIEMTRLRDAYLKQ